jgi:hypothetical protein
MVITISEDARIELTPTLEWIFATHTVDALDDGCHRRA